MSFLQFASTLNSNAPFAATLEFDAVLRYVDLVRCLKPTIAPQEVFYHLNPPKT
jgi:hypothetical protein